MDSMPQQPPSEIHAEVRINNFKLDANAFQYGGSDYSNAIRVERGISLERAFEIAKSDPEIGYFCYTKGYSMVLCAEDKKYDKTNDPLSLVTYTDFRYDRGDLGRGYCRIFHHGDTVFFKKEGRWLGSATGLGDTYIKD